MKNVNNNHMILFTFFVYIFCFIFIPYSATFKLAINIVQVEMLCEKGGKCTYLRQYILQQFHEWRFIKFEVCTEKYKLNEIIHYLLLRNFYENTRFSNVGNKSKLGQVKSVYALSPTYLLIYCDPAVTTNAINYNQLLIIEYFDQFN